MIQQKKPFERWTGAEIQRLKELRRNHSLVTCARLLGRTLSAVKGRCHLDNITGSYITDWQSLAPTIREMLAYGKTRAEICKALDVDADTLSYAVRTYKLDEGLTWYNGVEAAAQWLEENGAADVAERIRNEVKSNI